jgi:hypothetical protein
MLVRNWAVIALPPVTTPASPPTLPVATSYGELVDGRKDQSYFLYHLPQEVLAACHFLLGIRLR